MSTMTTPQPPHHVQGPPPEELKLPAAPAAARAVRTRLLKAALRQAFVMLRPDIQWKNPVMFVVEVGTVLTYHLHDCRPDRAAPSQVPLGYLSPSTSGCS